MPIAFTQWIAGWLRQPYTEPVVTSAYVARLPETATLEQLGLRRVDDAGKVWLFVPEDDGVFLETRTIQDLPIVLTPRYTLIFCTRVCVVPTPPRRYETGTGFAGNEIPNLPRI